MARPRSRDAHDRLIQATLELVAAEGVSGLSVEAIARRSGVAKTTLYRHFGGLEGVVFAAIGAAAVAGPGPDTGSLEGDLREIQRAYLASAASPAGREIFAWMLARAVQSDEAAAMFRKARYQPGGPTTIALQRAIARGEIPPTIDLEFALHIIQGPLISKRFVEGNDLTDAEFDALMSMTLRALGADPAV